MIDPVRPVRDAAGGICRTAGTVPTLRIPRTRAETIATYGNPGRGVASPAWVKANIVTCRDGNGDRPSMPGVPPRWYFQSHRLAEPIMREAFRRAAVAAPAYRIERAGCFVFRHQRHDASRPLSIHAFGAAVDVDAAANRAIEFEDGQAPEPWSPEWMRLWPHGLPRAFVEAFEACGFVWGGRWRSFKDPMHFQLAASTA